MAPGPKLSAASEWRSHGVGAQRQGVEPAGVFAQVAGEFDAVVGQREVGDRHAARQIFQIDHREDANAVRVEKARHVTRVARPRRRAGDDDPVKARQHAVQVRRMSLSQRRSSHGGSPRHRFDGYRIACLVPALPA